MTTRLESWRRRAAFAPMPDGNGFYLIRSECGEQGWSTGTTAELTHWEEIRVDDKDEADKLARAWMTGGPKSG